MKPELRAQIQEALATRYTLDRDLGRGGMASVVLARDVVHGHAVALKVLHPELASTVGADRFKREIRVAASLQHPNILGIIDAGQTEQGHLWFTMPFVEGENVYERLQREQQIAPAEALRIATAVAGALAYAHKHGVVHRDMKPDNILLSGDEILVADFGVARAVSEVAEKLTATGMIVGTPTYMSPEQASGDKTIDGRSDIFGLGCVLYEMLAGEPPFKGPESAGDADAPVHGTATPAPADGADPGIRRDGHRPRARQGSGRAIRHGGRVRRRAGRTGDAATAAEAGGGSAGSGRYCRQEGVRRRADAGGRDWRARGWSAALALSSGGFLPLGCFSTLPYRSP